MEDKKVIKMEKDTATGRLQSLKLPRDLSLGFAKPKKQYTPNLNVVRNKDKPKEFLKKIDQKRKDRTSNRNKYDKTDNKSRYIQSAGVFSQGSAENKNLSSHVEKTVRSRESSSASDIALPTLNQNSWKVNIKKEAAVLDDLMSYDVDSDEENSSFKPLTLSVDSKEVKDANRAIIKKEESDLGVSRSIPEPFNREDVNEENPTLSLVRLPDSFAGKGLSDDPNVKKLFDYPLSGMLEGQIGKLVIRKSSKMEVHIGSIKYELNPENTFESKEELATVVNSENNETCIAVLGNVLNNFVMFPDYDELLKKK